eukprot:CAMPEP_0168792226 /NCGR_PEP_ID=MMETSP0725-20121227/14408_1 /TAXON_ID=265536 /ORGANISM="Amphiprora sp., Strain CCMP467" /LENGTH=468 /DNA_ID=CAMNT_0008842859 /DNA_START=218 /DNA_END=1621 /DNA_ORIENTATION=+
MTSIVKNSDSLRNNKNCIGRHSRTAALILSAFFFTAFQSTSLYKISENHDSASKILKHVKSTGLLNLESFNESDEASFKDKKLTAPPYQSRAPREAQLVKVIATSSGSGGLSSSSSQQEKTPALAEDQSSPARTNASNATNTSNEEQAPGIVIFYNVFVPDNTTAKRSETAKKVILEQLQQVAKCSLLHKKNTTNVHVRFVSIGANDTGTIILKHCQNMGLQCEHLEHHQQGFENKTLVHLHHHCTKHARDRIIYMHNKGSFNQEGTDPFWAGQGNWRRSMTHAATSSHCDKGLSDNSCDVCGLFFQPLPYHHFPGNIWTTQCSYIQKVHKWDVLEAKRAGMVEKMQKQGKFAPLLWPPTIAMIGGGDRFMAEYWIGSHPNMRPCQVARNISLAYWKEANRDPATEFELSHSPTVPFAHQGWDFYRFASTRQEILNNTMDRLRDFYLLQGSLYKWREIYKEIPHKNSW